MEILTRLVVLLATADDQLLPFKRHVGLIAGEARNRQRDAQALGLAVISGNPLDIVRRIPLGGLRYAIESTLDFVESKQKRAGQGRNSGHGLKALGSDFDGALSAPLKGRPDQSVPAGQPQYGGRRLRLQEWERSSSFDKPGLVDPLATPTRPASTPEPEQRDRVGSADDFALRLADLGMIEPVGGIAEILERIIDGKHDALGPDLRNRVDQCGRTEMP